MGCYEVSPWSGSWSVWCRGGDHLLLVLKGGGWVGAQEPSPGRGPADAEGAKINRENFRQEIKCRIEVNFTDFKIEF